MSYYDFMLQDPEVQKIIDAHKNDFTNSTVKSFLEKKGGYKAYIRSLGGVFKKYADFSGKITSKEQIREICDYVWGLYQIWGVDYSNGCSTSWDESGYKAKCGRGSAFYPSASPSSRYGVNYGTFGFNNGDDLPGIDEMLGNPGKYYAVTNCDQGVLQVLKKAGLVPQYFPGPAEYPAYYKERGYGYKVIRNMRELQPGDVLCFSHGSIPTSTNYSNWPSWFFHTSIVAENTGTHIITFDSGHAYTYYGEPRTKRPVTGSPYEWCNDWIALRYDVVDKLSKPTGWKKISGDWYYYENGSPVTGWHELKWSGGKNWFWFDSSGRMISNGLYQVPWAKGKKLDWFLFDKNGCCREKGKFKVNCKFNSKGQLTGGN